MPDDFMCYQVAFVAAIIPVQAVRRLEVQKCVYCRRHPLLQGLVKDYPGDLGQRGFLTVLNPNLFPNNNTVFLWSKR